MGEPNREPVCGLSVVLLSSCPGGSLVDEATAAVDIDRSGYSELLVTVSTNLFVTNMEVKGNAYRALCRKSRCCCRGGGWLGTVPVDVQPAVGAAELTITTTAGHVALVVSGHAACVEDISAVALERGQC